MKDYIEFNDGNKMPIVGYGMWQANVPEHLEQALDKALEVGYRHYDTAFAYQNEDVFGRVLSRWFSTKVKREDLFIVTKLPVFGTHPDRVEHFLKLSLKRLQLEYVDLYLIHNPACLKANAEGTGSLRDSNGDVVIDTTSTIEETWKAMEAQVKAGRTKSIGLSNFSSSQIERIVKVAAIKPANLQIEMNVYYRRKPLVETCKKHGITLCAYAPIGSPGRAESYKGTAAHTKIKIPQLLSDPVILEVAQKFNKTPAQVLLRFLAQQGIAVIPKSVTPARIAENFNIYDFELDAESLAKIDALDTGKDGTWGTDWQNGQEAIKNHPEFLLVE
jgi:aldehyde reductase